MKDIVIDGYNLLHAMARLPKRAGPQELEKARTRLLTLLQTAAATGTMTVVFDARHAPSFVPSQTHWQGIRVHFARDEEADDVIEALIAKHSAPRNLTVVSDDHRLRRAAGRRRACSMSCHDFLHFLRERQQQQRANPSDKIDRLSPEQTRQLLEDFAHLDEELKREFKQFDFDDDAR